MATSKKAPAKEEIKKAASAVKAEAEKSAKAVKTETKKATEKAKENTKTATKAVKESAKKSAGKAKDTVKKAEAAAKKAKTDVYFEFGGTQVDASKLYDMAEKSYIKAGGKKASIKSMQLYVKAEDKAVYYVVNNKETGKISL